MKSQHIVLLANDTTYVYNLRREVLERLIKEGYRITIVSQLLLMQEELKALGCRLVGVDAGRHGTNPIDDIKLLCTYILILHKEKPDVVLSYNIKPNAYGGMACQLLGIRYMPNITGLGTAVEYPGKMQQLTTRLYKWGVARADCIFFQNEENRRFFEDRHMMPKKARVVLLPGSGVNLKQHQAMEYPLDDTVHFLFIARIMREKGIDLYLAAAKRVCEKYNNIMFHICGQCDDEKYIGILKEAQKNGYICYHGEQKDMVPFFRMAHCIVHPSYYPEGMSNVLLEAAASARPIIATDRSGCRETVDEGKTGFVIPIKDEDALVEAIDRILDMSIEERRDMGLAGRTKMEQEFDREIVAQKYLEAVSKGA